MRSSKYAMRAATAFVSRTNFFNTRNLQPKGLLLSRFYSFDPFSAVLNDSSTGDLPRGDVIPYAGLTEDVKRPDIIEGFGIGAGHSVCNLFSFHVDDDCVSKHL